MRNRYENFELVIFKLLIESGLFKEVKRNVVIEGRELDILAKGVIQNNFNLFYVFELKNYSKPLGVSVVEQFYARWHSLRRDFNPSVPVIVCPSSFSQAAILKAKDLGIELWGQEELINLVSAEKYNQLVGDDLDFLPAVKQKKNEENIPEQVKKEDSLSEVLRSILPGTSSWLQYQLAVSDIVEYLFTPPLESPQYENADEDKRNRRDIIFENTASKGFWRTIKEDYSGHYIVIDAKNYSKKLTKRPILDIAHYLKPYGCGMFGIIISRKGLGPSGEHARKEQWIGNNKMIVVLDDSDLLLMLNEKKNENHEEIIRQKIATFRMSL